MYVEDIAAEIYVRALAIAVEKGGPIALIQVSNDELLRYAGAAKRAADIFMEASPLVAVETPMARDPKTGSYQHPARVPPTSVQVYSPAPGVHVHTPVPGAPAPAEPRAAHSVPAPRVADLERGRPRVVPAPNEPTPQPSGADAPDIARLMREWTTGSPEDKARVEALLESHMASLASPG